MDSGYCCCCVDLFENSYVFICLLILLFFSGMVVVCVFNYNILVEEIDVWENMFFDIYYFLIFVVVIEIEFVMF